MPVVLSDTAIRHDALLLRVSTLVSARSGRSSAGALIGPRLLFLPSLNNLSDERLIRLGTAVELLRRATIVHRAPKDEATWTEYGDTRFSQTLRGDSLLAESFRLLAADGNPRTVSILSHAMALVSAGELQRREAPEAAVPRLAAYYEGAAEAGALLAGLSPADTAEYVAWGRDLGFVREAALAGVRPPAGLRESLVSRSVVLERGLRDALLERLDAPE